MTENLNEVPTQEVPAPPPSSGKHFWLTIALWILIAIAVWAFFVSSAISIPVFIVLCVVIHKLAARWGTTFNAIMFPKPIADWLQKRWIIRIFAAALKRPLSAFLIGTSVIPIIIIGIITLGALTESILDLDQMGIVTETIESIKTSTKMHSTIIMKNEPVSFWTVVDKERLQKLQTAMGQKQKVKIWYQYSPVDKQNNIWQIQIGDEIIQKYDKTWLIKESLSERNFAIFLGVTLVLFYLYIIAYFAKRI